MSEIELIGVPYDGYGRTGNQALASFAMRNAGLVEAFASHRVLIDDVIDLPAADPRRGEDTSLINEAALVAMTDSLNSRVSRAVRDGRFPFVYGGDCSSLLGTVTGLRDALGSVGLLFIDGHEDTMPLDVSEDGEAANTEIGLLLGLTGQLMKGPLRQRLPALRFDRLAMLGQRDDAWRRQFNVGSLRDRGVWSRTVDEVASDPSSAGRDAVKHVSRDNGRWWLHVDLDVLDPVAFPAQGLPGIDDEPGGLSWSQLTQLLIAAVGAGSCLGWSLAIYDPEQDASGAGARRITDLVRTVAATIT
jgi:arginase